MKTWKRRSSTNREPDQLLILGSDEEELEEGSVTTTTDTIFFYSDITNSSILELNKFLYTMDISLQKTKNRYGDNYDPIIKLRMNTGGGEIFSALSTLDLMSSLKSKVYTYVDGCNASAGTLISIAGDRRFMGKHANMLIHQLSGEIYGKYSEMEDAMDGNMKLMKCIKTIYTENTEIPMKKLDELLNRDVWLTAEDCLQYGMVDELF